MVCTSYSNGGVMSMGDDDRATTVVKAIGCGGSPVTVYGSIAPQSADGFAPCIGHLK